MKILIVDDNRANQLVLRFVLKRSGYTCDIAENGKEAFEKAMGYDYKLIFMDLMMPIMDGYESMEAILSQKNEQKIVAVTANTGSEVEQRCYDIGAVGFIRKPIEFGEIENALYRWAPKQTTITEVEDSLSFQ